ncbi:caspase family protein [Streptomyces montanus]|uniref:Caspase family protein n=1 Tax=Streptomyces montanus TaxID=2580423 RepID=A0A5R9FH71_9ACTN|nr:caspase family protein [Streptomyces montanus]TLS41526.1 caspase family protein [Streptomyces montanus]
MYTHWPSRVPDRSDSLAVLVGTAGHIAPSELPPLPQAAANVADLKQVLTGPTGLFDPLTVHTVVDPPTPAQVLNILTLPGPTKRGLVLFYFAGHGILDTEDQLCLALPESIDKPRDAARTGLSVNSLFAALKHVRAQRKVVILDCCFAGRALYDSAVGDVHVLCATGRPYRALTNADERNTGFTTALLRLLTEGLPDGPEFLDLSTLYRRLAVLVPTTPCPSDDEPERTLPAPRHRTTDITEDVALVRNTAFGTSLSRTGLRSRAQFAQRVAEFGRRDSSPRSEYVAHAGTLFAEIAADAMSVFPRVDPQVLRYRRAHAALAGEAGNAARAAEILKGIIGDLEAAAPGGGADCKADRLSLEHWLNRVPDPNTPRF